MYGVRVNIDFVVRKNDGYGIIFKDGVRVRVRVKLALKPWYGIRKWYGNILKWRVRVRNFRRKKYGFPFFCFVSVSDQYFIKNLYPGVFLTISGRGQFVIWKYTLEKNHSYKITF